ARAAAGEARELAAAARHAGTGGSSSDRAAGAGGVAGVVRDEGEGLAWAGLAGKEGEGEHGVGRVAGARGPEWGQAGAQGEAAVRAQGGAPRTTGPLRPFAVPGRADQMARAGASQSAEAGFPIEGLLGPVKGEQLVIDLNLPKHAGPTWRLPPTSLLRRTKHAEVDRRQVEALGKTLESALAAHGVETRLVGATVGPSVTRYELELGSGVKVQRVTALQRDIAYAMAAAEVRIQAPIPGRSAIGVEVPNRQRQVVSLGDVLASPEAALARHPLEVPAGRDIAGRPVMVNLAEMPHLLIAGATGSGKSSWINSMLISVLTRATPNQVRLILVDPKRVELGAYAGLPHLLTNVVTNPKKAANALRWAVEEMEHRYDLLAEVGMRDITGYNAAWDRGELAEPLFFGREVDEELEEDLKVGTDGQGGEEALDGPGRAGRPSSPEGLRFARLPFILVVVDELNDLMMVAARDVEESICRIAQMARAVGIHLVLATQRPSVDVITGLIKANIPSRLAFAVSSLADSRVVLDQSGAERLIGKGDLLLLTASSSLARRLQAPWAEEEDVHKVVAHWRRQAGPSYVRGVEGPEGPEGQGADDGEDGDDLLGEAMELVVRSQLGSTSMLQRKLRVGFARAGRLMDLLEQRGVVGPSEGSKARAVLMTVDELAARGNN
ncbi:MAG TPA: DNA translocase FtsK, partial [Acidimicrobiales bacterium]|nr:DNA translocase FtsK [Acidimicrobiales bacterium]